VIFSSKADQHNFLKKFQNTEEFAYKCVEKMIRFIRYLEQKDWKFKDYHLTKKPEKTEIKGIFIDLMITNTHDCRIRMILGLDTTLKDWKDNTYLNTRIQEYWEERDRQEKV
jgi:hypothetical protein